MISSFDTDWNQMLSEGSDPLDPSWEFSQDPVLGLPRIPYQAAQIDPAQDPFQFPFQFPSENPQQGDPQYSPVDLPENQLQQTYDPFDAMNELDTGAENWSDKFDPHNTLVATAYDIGKAFAEEQGFDLGVFGELNLGDSAIGNAWTMGKRAQEDPETAWDWAGDFPQLFDEAAGAIGEFVGNLMPDFAKQPEGAADNQAPPGTSNGGMADLIEFATQANDLHSAAPFWGSEIASSPVANQVEQVAETGVDLAAPSIVQGAVTELIGADVLPSTQELFSAIGLGI